MTPAFPIPDEALDDRLGFVGTSGSGKTYNAAAAVERLLESGARVVIVDPLDVWWGLRLRADGRDEAFKLPIFGGAHGDLPLSERAGKLIGETVASMSDSCIVSLAAMSTKEAERRFMLDFLEALYRKANGSSFHVIFDEADLWAPQGAGSGSGPKLQSLMEQIVRRGRVKGFIPWLLTQRPAVISKDVLSQVDGLVAFKMTSSQDRKAIGEWVRGQADPEQWSAIWSVMPTMTAGKGVVWIPARNILKTVQFPLKATFDSSRAPKRGERRQARDLKPLDLDNLKGKLANIEQDAKANDPSVLKAELQRVKRELVKATSIRNASASAPTWPDQRELVAQLTADLAEHAATLERLTAASTELLRRQQAALVALGGEIVSIPAAAPRQRRVAPTPPPVPKPNGALPETVFQPQDGITKPQQRILDALAWWAAFGIDQPTSEQVAFIAQYSPGSGGFNNLKGGLRSMGLIDYPSGGRVSLTAEGRAVSFAPAIEPDRDAFHSAVARKLSGPQWRVLEPAISSYPDSIASDEIAAQAGYSAGSGGFNNLRGSLRTLGLIDYPSPGRVKASDWLFP